MNRRRKNFTRAQRKKAKKTFKVGDVVTWGLGLISHRVIEVLEHGVKVDISKSDLARYYGNTYFVAFDHNARNGVYHHEGGKGVRLSHDVPDVKRPTSDPLTGKSFPHLTDDERREMFG
jgi:hypothetical protein